jgi:glutamine synthetase
MFYTSSTSSDQGFGSNVFDIVTMKERLPAPIFKRFKKSLESGVSLDNEAADVIATAIKDWAGSKGVSHFSHQFQPMTSAPAEKHDAFLNPHVGGAISEFPGKRMLSGETDGSSFPSGGLRVTHEARGYTSWDPASPCFISTVVGDPTLIVPTLFYSWKGDALDRKIPLLRSTEAVKETTLKLFSACGLRKHKKIHTESGIEQEFFLLKEEHVAQRPDLQICGRTLQGRHPAKGQELSDSYFGLMTPKALDCLHEVEEECWKLGIPLITRQ